MPENYDYDTFDSDVLDMVDVNTLEQLQTQIHQSMRKCKNEQSVLAKHIADLGAVRDLINIKRGKQQ